MYTYPPDIPEKAKAQYLHLPARIVVATHDSSQTAKNDLEDNGAEADTAGIRRDKNVAK